MMTISELPASHAILMQMACRPTVGTCPALSLSDPAPASTGGLARGMPFGVRFLVPACPHIGLIADLKLKLST